MSINALPPVRTLPDLVRRVAASRPHDEAVTDGRERLTWSEYDERIAAVAAGLAAIGIRNGDRVAVLSPKSVHAFVAVHGIQRAGAVVVPVDWFAPEQHVRSVLDDAEVAAVVGALDASHRSMVGDLVPVVDPSAATNGDGSDIGLVANQIPGVDVSPDDPAYIIYTSGSTGLPKGIVHSHASALAYARAAASTYGLDEHDRVANIAPLHFDQSTFELYAAPLAGSAAIVVPDGVIRFPSSLGRMLSSERATVLYTVPYVIRQLVERGGAADLDLGALRWVKFGGESFPSAALRAAMAAIPGARFSNVYGPAEVNQCTFHHVGRNADDAVEEPTDTIPIGQAWEGVDLIIVDPASGELTASEVAGELWVSGPTTMLGYWRRPDLDERVLVRRHGDDRTWYRTGDMVAVRPDGLLVFLGRIDHQVKIRGQRIELEAVDAVLLQHPGVTAATSFVVRSETAGVEDELIALVVLDHARPRSGDGDRSDDDPLLESLRALAAERLPRAAVPTRIIGRVTLPRTSSGKVDRTSARREFLRETRPPAADDTHERPDMSDPT